MNKKNHEITAILLATLSIFIFISLIQFKSEYNVSAVLKIFSGDSESWPITGALGASLSALLKKYFLGLISFSSLLFICQHFTETVQHALYWTR